MKITDQTDSNQWPPDAGCPPDRGLEIRDGARVAWVSNHEAILTYFERRIEPFGVVRVTTGLNGLDVWVGGELRYNTRRANKSFGPGCLWKGKSTMVRQIERTDDDQTRT